jgi:hypothetical protein
LEEFLGSFLRYLQKFVDDFIVFLVQVVDLFLGLEDSVVAADAMHFYDGVDAGESAFGLLVDGVEAFKVALVVELALHLVEGFELAHACYNYC